jgi:hypothetical protein
MMTHTLRAIGRRLRDDESGITLVEFMAASALTLGALGVICGFLISMYKGGAFAQGQTFTLNDARNTVIAIEKEVRSAESLVWCAPAGSCLEIEAISPTGDQQTVKYTHTGTDLERSVYDTSTSSWGTPQLVVERVSNGASDPLFDCDTTSTLLHVTIDLRLRPTPNSAPNYQLRTSVRPRNFPAVASCP